MAGHFSWRQCKCRLIDSINQSINIILLWHGRTQADNLHWLIGRPLDGSADAEARAVQLTLQMVRAEFAAVEANAVVVDSSKEFSVNKAYIFFCVFGCHLSLEKTSVPKIFIGPSKIFMQIFAYFRSFTATKLSASRLLCCSVSQLVLMGRPTVQCVAFFSWAVV